MRNLPAHIRYALRQFRQSPVFTAAAILTLALGIGGSTALFTLIDAVVLRSLPVADPARLYRIGDGDDCCVEGSPQGRWGMYSFQLYQRLKAEAPEFEELAAFQAGAGFTRLSVRRQGAESAARPLHSEFVTGNYFSTFGVSAFGGRLLTPNDDKPGALPAAVLSYRIWQTAYGADPTVLGASFVVQNQPFTVVGVAPPGFYGETLRGDPPDIWLPVQQEPLVDGDAAILRQSFAAWLRVIGRLRPGASVAGTAPRLSGVLRQWLRNNPDYPPNWKPDIIRGLPKQVINIVPAGAGVAEMKDYYSRSLEILAAVCAAVLLIVCANVANLLLARAAARRGQTAVRLAVGASGHEVVLEALTESVLLALGGALAGLIVARAAARLLLALAFHSAHFLPISTAPSLRVLAFACGLALVTGIVFGAAPAWFQTRTDPAEALRSSGRGSIGRLSVARKALLVVQATLSVVLVAGATMLGHSLNNLEHQDFGYQLPGRVLVALQTPPASYSPPKLHALYRELEERLHRLPGVAGAGLALYNPLTNNWGEFIMVAGHPPGRMDESSGSSWDRVSTSYLQDLGMRILRGHGFSTADNDNTDPVAVVNQAFVKRFFKSDEDPIGQHFGLDLPENAGTFRIVGIVADAKFQSWRLNRPPVPMFFVPLAQSAHYANPVMQKLELNSFFISGLVLVTNTPTGTLEPLVTKELASLDPNLTVISVRSLSDQVALSFDKERAVATLAGLFGIVALLLAAVGLYGVTAYSVAQRTNEIGIRMALGADRRRVVQLMLRGAFERVLLGLLLGVPLAIGAGRLVAAELYGVTSWDPLALSLAAAALGISAALAALIPARRAASISPMEALRTE